MSTLDWAAFSEADEESRQALFRRAAKLEPAISMALQSPAKKGRKKGVSETAEAEPKKVSKASSKKSASIKKSEGSVAGGGGNANENLTETIGTGAWVSKQMASVGLSKLVARLSAAIPLELLVHVDTVQLDAILRANKNEPFPEPIDYIKLQCLIRSMHVQVTGSTGNSSKLRSPALGISSPLSSPSGPSVSSSSSNVDVATLLQGDILLWDSTAVQLWMNSVPALRKFAESFEHNQIDGHRLLRLNDRKLLQRLKMESDSDRSLIMQHVGDLKALQLTHAASTHSDILNKLIEGLSSELSQLHKVSANPVTSLLSSKRVPNYFISLRIGCLELRAKVKKIQSEIEMLVPELSGSRSMLPPEQLHFTLGRLYLQTNAEIALAKKLLEECYEKVYQTLYPESSEVAVNFKGVTNYGGNTVFLETERGNERDLLIEFGNTVYDIFQAAGLTSKEFRFQPVAPILRVRQSKKPLMMRLQEASSTLLETYANASLGRNIFSSLDISAVADQTDADGYYKTLHSVTLK